LISIRGGEPLEKAAPDQQPQLSSAVGRSAVSQSPIGVLSQFTPDPQFWPAFAAIHLMSRVYAAGRSMPT